MMNRSTIRRGIWLYGTVDFFTALVTWIIFFVLRKIFIDHVVSNELRSTILQDRRFFLEIILIPVGWLILYYVTGTYTNIYLKSRATEISRTFFVTLAGVILLFFILIINDQVKTYQDYYESVTILFLIHFSLTSFGRIFVLNAGKRRMVTGNVSFPTLLVGGNKKAIETYSSINGKAKGLGYGFVGFIDTNGNGNGLSTYLPKLGRLNDLPEVIGDHRVKQVIIAIESSEHYQLKEILNHLADRNVIIKIVPDMYDILAGSVRMNHLLGESFIEIYPELMSRWQYILKRMTDVIVSVLALILLFPLYLFVALRVKLSSSGPIFYKQERVGLHGKPFYIYKFRSMYMNAETNGPLLSSKDDSRVTRWGRVMRKWRLDELPQFYNVLKGEMSIVGPRPERKYYIDQILRHTTDYKHLHRVQPGITSLGMVKFGYAENVQEMIQRMKYDLLYIENMSLMLDLKILLYTLRTILQGRGR